jgi:hypothetical protein
VWSALSDERTCLSFTIVAFLRQCSHSRVWIPRDSWPHFTVSDFRPLRTCRARSLYLYPQEQNCPIILPDIGFPFRRLLRPAEGGGTRIQLQARRTENVSSAIRGLIVERKTTYPRNFWLATAVVLSPVCTTVAGSHNINYIIILRHFESAFMASA